MKKNLPSPVGRVGARQYAGEYADADAAGVEVVGDGQHFLDRTAEAVELPDDERVPGAQVAERAAGLGRSLAALRVLIFGAGSHADWRCKPNGHYRN